MKKLKYGLCIGAISFALSACGTNPHVFKIGPDTYTSTTTGSTGFVPLGRLKAEAYRQAQTKAASEGREIEVISVNEVPAGFAKWPQVEIRFRLLSKQESEAKRLKAVEVIHSDNSHNADGDLTSSTVTRQKSSSEVTHRENSSKYKELAEIAELRKAGVLTEEEFQAEKKRILSEQR